MDELGHFSELFFAGVPADGAPALAYSSLTGSANAFAAAALARRPAPGGVPFVLAVARGLPEADALAADLKALSDAGEFRVLEFPPALEDDVAAASARLKTAAALGSYSLRPYPCVVVAPVLALGNPVACPGEASAAGFVLAAGGSVTFSALLARLAAAGYERAPEVVAPGAYSVRGGVVDAWPPDRERPVRAEFFGEDLEELREFDPAVQTSVGTIARAEIAPVAVRGVREEKLLEDLLPAGGTVLWLEQADDPVSVRPLAACVRAVYTGDPAPRGALPVAFQTSPLPGFAESGDALRVADVRGRLARHLAAAKARGARVVESSDLSGGFEIAATASFPGLVVSCAADRLPGRRARLRQRSARDAAGERLAGAYELEPGELVVHLEYGVGRYLGTTEVPLDGRRAEVFAVEYADGAKVYVPVDHAHLLSRYVGVKGRDAKLHAVDGRRWARDKTAAERAVRDLAASLLETQARRATAPGFAYDADADGVAEFEAAFPHETTPDQAKAIADVKRDMAAAKPMDRLVCGDAGYGKTEVAMRAACIAALNGRQTVLLAPTTVLAEQHYETFLARFDATPVRVEAMSRFQTAAEKEGTRARLESGATDVVIGTHALLTERTRFRNLGLVIIDEEQRFGVRHKEFLKGLRATADVLTMSATPIPRTLYLAMTGARDLSVLRTPPRERVAVETVVERRSDAAVAATIARELERGGQVYFLHNRVSTIGAAERWLRALCPGARVEVAHGQMPTRALAAKMRHFAQGRADVLLCTTIVESGLDIPRANTILVDHAERFGLAELYQLRGRVGRGSRKGHAHFLLPESGAIDSDARERLAALKKHSGLGAGFDLSVRDLELRGSGNLLGREQSGHVAAVGFSLYCQLLRRTIARLKGEKVPELVDVVLNLDFLNPSPGAADPVSGACLPYEYVEEEAQRAEIHCRLASAADVPEIRRLARELTDRYGRMPPAAGRLLRLAEFRVRCAAAGVGSVDASGDRAVFRRPGTRETMFEARLPRTGCDGRLAALAAALRALRRGGPRA